MKWNLVRDFRCAHLDSKNNFPLKLLFDLPRQPPIRALSLASLGFDLPWAAWNHGALLLWAESSLILWGAMLCRNPLWNCALFSLDNLDWDPVPIKIEETSFSWVEAKERTVSSVTCSLERSMLSSLERLFRWLGFYWCVLLSHDFHLQITPTGE